MKITVQTTTFSRELFKVQGIANAKTTMPVLQNILLEATEDGRVLIKVTNLEISLSTEISGDDVQVHQPGLAVLRARDLHETVRNLKSESLTLEKDDQQWVTLVSGTVRARFVGTNPDEYPAIPTVDAQKFAEIPTDRFIRAADLVLFAVSKDPSRPHLCGSFLHIRENGQLGFAATDGHRLALASFDFNTSELPDALKQGVIIPRKGIEELRRSIDLTCESIGVVLEENTMVFRQNVTLLFVKLIDGAFPNIAQVFPQENEERKAVIDRAMLADRIKLVSLFTNQRTRNLRIELQEGTCIISAHDNDTGEIEERLPVAYSGPTVRAGFNSQYILDILSTLRCAEISLEIPDSLKPSVVHELDVREGDDSIFIIMPMRI